MSDENETSRPSPETPETTPSTSATFANRDRWTLVKMTGRETDADLKALAEKIFTTLTAPAKPQKFAVNRWGQQTTLPAKPERDDFPDEESWEEAVDSWMHQVYPLLRIAPRPSNEPPPAPPAGE